MIVFVLSLSLVSPCYNENCCRQLTACSSNLQLRKPWSAALQSICCLHLSTSFSAQLLSARLSSTCCQPLTPTWRADGKTRSGMACCATSSLDCRFCCQHSFFPTCWHLFVNPSNAILQLSCYLAGSLCVLSSALDRHAASLCLPCLLCHCLYQLWAATSPGKLAFQGCTALCPDVYASPVVVFKYSEYAVSGAGSILDLPELQEQGG